MEHIYQFLGGFSLNTIKVIHSHNENVSTPEGRAEVRSVSPHAPPQRTALTL